MSSVDVVEVKKEPLSPDTSVSEEAAAASTAAGGVNDSSSSSSSTAVNNVEAALENLDIKKEIKEEPKSDDYNKLLNYGLDGKVASRLESIYITGRIQLLTLRPLFALFYGDPFSY